MSAIHFGNAFAFVLEGLRVASTNAALTSAIGTAQLRNRAGEAIGSAVSLDHQGGGDYRASFSESLFDDHPVELAIGKLITIEVIGTAPAFRFDVVGKVKARG